MVHRRQVVPSLGRLEFASAKEVFRALRIGTLHITSIVAALVARTAVNVIVVVLI